MNNKKVTGLLVSSTKTRKEYVIRRKNRNYWEKWGTTYDSYKQYLNEEIHKPITSSVFSNGLLYNGVFGYQPKIKTLSIIDEFDLATALNGGITTNPDGTTDTALGKLNNQLYSISLFNSAQANKQRKRNEDDPETGYITPSLYYVYGTEPENLTKLTSLFSVGNEKRIDVESITSGVTILHNGIDSRYLTKTDNTRHATLFELFERANKYYEDLNDLLSDDVKYINGSISDKRYSPFINDSQKYVDEEFSDDGWSINIKGAKFDGIDSAGNNAEYTSRLYSHKSKIAKERTYLEWGEKDVKGDGTLAPTSEQNIGDFGTYGNNIITENNLLAKTNRLFNQHKIQTLVARFHTSNDNDYNTKEESFDSAKDNTFGNSHGRALLKLGAKTNFNGMQNNGYSDPYCRAWTYHHQYSKYKHTLRPFHTPEPIFSGESDSEGKGDINIKYRSRFTDKGIERGGEYLVKNTVLQTNGLVKFSPVIDDVKNNLIQDTRQGKSSDIDPSRFTQYNGLKKYMFSIENLAWADGSSRNRRNLSVEQIGPNNGRIMWFPPYNLSFQENVSVAWNQNAFIGRGEKVYTYSNTDRKGTLSFTILIDHPAIVNSMANYGGKSPDRDPEGDLLRFFAGCDVVDPDYKLRNEIYDPAKEDEPVDNTEDNEDIEEPIPEPTVEPIPEPDPIVDIKIIFYVFFPNNYSGYMRACNTPSNVPNDRDDDWHTYLIGCRNIDSHPTNYIGYEMCENGSTVTEGSSDKDYIVSCGKDSNGRTSTQADFVLCKTTNGHKYFYRVDQDLNQGFLTSDSHEGSKEGNYRDYTSYKLNSSFNAVSPKFNDATFSFAEIMQYFYEKHLTSETEHCKYIGKKIDRDRSGKTTNELENIFDNYKVKEIIVEGKASAQDNKNAKELARRRGNTTGHSFKQWLGEMDLLTNDAELKIDTGVTTYSASLNNCEEAKLGKCARVEFVLGGNEIKDPATTDNEISNANQLKEGTPETNEEDFASNSEYWAKYEDAYGFQRGTGYANYKFDSNYRAGTDTYYTDKELNAIKKKRIAEERGNTVTYKKISNNNSDIVNGQSTVGRYDDEYRFFDTLKDEDPTAFKSIINKVKYFNPAYHSISPEGFNSRLTFLHQCTRQGHTMSASETNASIGATAGNLSFGKMPVCVLRIGDFINTRMIIESMSIDFKNGDSIQWDLNPEGAGVQPMFATVNLGIVLLGGQSLDGPISRLQNAVTFDYYANAGVYDDRADRIENNYDGTVTYKRIYTPMKANDSSTWTTDELGNKYDNNGRLIKGL